MLTEEQLDYFTEQTRRATRHALRRYIVGALIGWLILLAGVGLALQGKADSSDLHAAAVSSCKRVNILRAQSNVGDAVSFSILSDSGRRERALVRIAPPDERSAHRFSADTLLHQAQRLTITAPTNCKLAVDFAKTYKIPVAQPFGDAATGRLDPNAARIITESQALLNAQK